MDQIEQYKEGYIVYNLRTDLCEIHQHFDKFTEDQVLGIAQEQSPHYYNTLHKYRRKYPETKAGSLGFQVSICINKDSILYCLQGFNAGVVLYNLAKMRASEAYKLVAGREGMTRLAEKYKVVEFIGGDQDWITLIGWEIPELVYILPCQYNRQIQAMVDHDVSCFPTDKQIYQDYHDCQNRPIVLHMIGD